MRINNEFSGSNGRLFDCTEIKYALLGCLAFTNKHDKLREMLLYVLLSSATLVKKLAGEHTIYDIIDHMTPIIGTDYQNNKNYAPAEILSSLDKDSRMVLFNYMNDLEKKRHFDELSAGTFDGLSAGLPAAKQKLEEKLNCTYGDVKEMQIFQVDEYLKLVNDYLTLRLNQISISIAKELFNSGNRE